MQSDFSIHVASKDEFPQIAELVVGQNQFPERQCIHSSVGDRAEDILQVMLKWEKIGEIAFVLAQQDGRVVGALGSEFDEGLGRGWLWGPYALVQDWQPLANRLYQALLAALPPSIRQLGAFLNVLNLQGQDFYRALGFSTTNLAHDYSAKNLAPSVNESEVCRQLTPEYHHDFISLHSTIFPNAYYSAERVIEQSDDQNQIFVYPEDNQVLGYVYASFSGDSKEGEVEFLGVRQDSRGRGIGRQLLQTALWWLFEELKASQVTLTVNQDNVNARALYESVGFQLRYTGIGLECKLD
jgi:ribosomal protein S18 acetylase RimI-like enzyme